jgi:hypothetical protein
MNATELRTGRGDGIGIEVTQSVMRGVLLGRDQPGRLRAAAEVGLASLADDRTVLDAFVRLRAELAGAHVPTRLALFPPGSTLQRIEVTGRSGPELNAIRSAIERSHSISSTVLVDDGPRRWMMAVHWNETEVRRLEELAERAGFVDVSVDPSPIALARAVDPNASFVRRDAAPHESFDVVLRTIPVAACAIESVGRQAPRLEVATVPVSMHTFDELIDRVDLVALVEQVRDDQLDDPQDGSAPSLHIGGDAFPPFPPHDIRAPERQCVALGAAIGAAGLAGRLRPIDMLLPMVTAAELAQRPWAIERMSTLPQRVDPVPTGSVQRAFRRIRPKRPSPTRRS